ncbi:MAG: hypothetical protein NC218_01910 [Acetobacter sp.]|nr:hypothetical protein [Acetobacter sp.]
MHEGYQYYIVHTGMSFCCYVQSKGLQKHELCEEEYLVHGGITFYGSLRQLIVFSENDDISEELYFGWDYAHCCDKTPMNPQGKDWTVEEVREEAFAFIKALKGRNK